MGLKQIHLRVYGRVQGVFYRAGSQREAKRLGLTGWVKNLPDESVELVAEGDEAEIREFVAWAHHGPGAARVERVEVSWRSYDGELFDFRVAE